MKKQPVYSPETRERAVRLLLSTEHEHASRWQATNSISKKIGCTPETLRNRVKQSEIDSGKRPGISTEDTRRLMELERENRELKRANVRY